MEQGSLWTLYSDVKASEIHWLWYPYIAAGKITILEGDPEDGKSTMMMDEYAIWNYETPGISFNVKSGRITIFKTTLKAMGYPEYFHFLFTPEEQMFAIEPCEYDAEGAYRLPDIVSREHYDLKCKNLVRYIFSICGWKKQFTYRIPGTLFAPDSHLVAFDLRSAYEIHEGRVKEIM